MISKLIFLQVSPTDSTFETLQVALLFFMLSNLFKSQSQLISNYKKRLDIECWNLTFKDLL